MRLLDTQAPAPAGAVESTPRHGMRSTGSSTTGPSPQATTSGGPVRGQRPHRRDQRMAPTRRLGDVLGEFGGVGAAGGRSPLGCRARVARAASLRPVCTGGGGGRVDHAIIINDTRTTLRAATPSTPAQLTMSRSLAKVISATRLSSRSRAQGRYRIEDLQWPHAHFAFATDRERRHAPIAQPARTPVTETSGVRIAEPGGIKQVEIAFDRIPQFVLRVAAVATVLTPPAMIPVLVADLAQMSQRRAQVFPELQPPVGRLRDQPLQRPEVSGF